MEGSNPNEQQAGSTPDQDRLLIDFLKAKAQNGSVHQPSNKQTPEEERAEAEFGQAQEKLNSSGLSEELIRTISRKDANEQSAK